jgi:hypothetical protein
MTQRDCPATGILLLYGADRRALGELGVPEGPQAPDTKLPGPLGDCGQEPHERGGEKHCRLRVVAGAPIIAEPFWGKSQGEGVICAVRAVEAHASRQVRDTGLVHCSDVLMKPSLDADEGRSKLGVIPLVQLDGLEERAVRPLEAAVRPTVPPLVWVRRSIEEMLLMGEEAGGRQQHESGIW